MKPRRLIPCLLFGGLPAFATGIAVAADAPFAIQVPVDLRDIHPDVQSGEIVCQIKDAQDAPVAGGTVQFSIDRGTRSFNRTVPVSARLADGRSALDARTYQCMLYLKDYQGGVSLQPGTPSAQGKPKFEPAAGTPFTPLVSGPIPSSLPSIPAPATPLQGAIKTR